MTSTPRTSGLYELTGTLNIEICVVGDLAHEESQRTNLGQPNAQVQSITQGLKRLTQIIEALNAPATPTNGSHIHETDYTYESFELDDDEVPF